MFPIIKIKTRKGSSDTAVGKTTLGKQSVQGHRGLDRPGASARLEEHQQLVALIAASILFILMQYAYDVTKFPYDAGDYWRLSSIRVLSDFPAEIRGYFYPLLLAPARFLSDSFPVLAYAPYRVISSVAYAYVLTSLLPSFYATAFGGRMSFWRRMVVPMLVLVLFPGLIVYTLSDLPALALMLGAALCAMRSSGHVDRSVGRCFLLILGGVLAYGAYNTRTIYLFPVTLFIFGFANVVYRDYPARTKLTATGTLLLGIAIASTPQALINYKNHGVLSPGVITIMNGKSLFAQQLLWGIAVQRYETAIDKSVPSPRVFYADKAGEQLILSKGVDTATFTIDDYFRLVWNNPVDFMGIYGRHIVNGLDLRDGDSYTMVRSSEKSALAVFNFVIVFSGLAIILMAAATHPVVNKLVMQRLYWALVALLPVLAIIPGSIETRYFLALHIAIYCAIAFSSDIQAITDILRKHWFMAVMVIGISAAIFFSISMSTMASMQYNYPVLHRDIQ